MYRSITGFEFTSVLSIFDLLSIRLVHGWLVDPSSKAAKFINSKRNSTYNQLVDRLISLQTQNEKENEEEGIIKKDCY